MMNKNNSASLFTEFLGKTINSKAIDFLIENKGADFCKSDIAKGAGISRTSLFYCWPAIEKAGILKPTRKFGKTALYTLDTKSHVVKKMLELEYILVSKFLDAETEKQIAKQIEIIKKK